MRLRNRLTRALYKMVVRLLKTTYITAVQYTHTNNLPEHLILHIVHTLQAGDITRKVYQLRVGKKTTENETNNGGGQLRKL